MRMVEGCVEGLSLDLPGRFLERQIRLAIVLALVIVCGGTSAATATRMSPLTVRDAIETTRLMVGDVDGARQVTISPNGRRYAAMLIRGDISRDGVEVEIIAGELTSLDAAKPYSVARLFTRGLGATMLGAGGESPLLLLPPANFPQWIDDARLAFLWDDENGVRQVVAANVEIREWHYLTKSTTDVTSFGAGGLNTVVYEAKEKFSLDKSEKLFQRGFAVTNPDAWSMLKGVIDGSSGKDIAWGHGEKYIQVGDALSTSARRLNVTGGGINTYHPAWPSIRPTVSPDGRFAIVTGTPQVVPDEWRQYQGKALQMVLEGSRTGGSRHLQQMFVVSIEDATARPLWSAPMDPSRFVTLRWAPDAKRAAVWPVYLPIGSGDQAGLSARAVAEVDVVTGEYASIPLAGEGAGKVVDVRWDDTRTVEVDLGHEVLWFQKQAGRWTEHQPSTRRAPSASVRVEVRQDLNTPPALYAIEVDTGREQMVFDPNPRLRKEFSLGEVKLIEWRDTEGRRREGRLFLPVGYRAGRQYPLVIQTRTWGSTRDFTLYGPGSPSPTLGPMYSVYLAQPLANQGIAVLQLGPRPADDQLSEATGWMRAIESAVDHLESVGTIDRNRVGVMGHSRAGWHVEYMLAFSDYPIAAAIADDNIDSGYFEAAMAGWPDVERRNGEQPFGAGMKDWLENAPAFNVEHIRSPLLLMQSDSFAGRATPIAGWEMFSRLRYLKKPVEFWVVPNIERGTHNLQNPTQLLTQQQRAMDWWLYWLKDARDPSEAKREQYASWDELRVLHDEDSQRPRPPRLRWTAEPQERCRSGSC